VSVDAEWSKDHVSVIGAQTLMLLDINVGENRDRVGPFRGISGTLRRKGQGECYGDSEVFFVVAPACVG
jgi:hypothetical protein